MMKNAKMNEKGKLLAIIAVFAMVFAGAAVVMSSEGVDAAGPATGVQTLEVTSGAATIATAPSTETANYYIGETAKLNISADLAGKNIAIYVLAGKTVTLGTVGTQGATAGTITFLVTTEEPSEEGEIALEAIVPGSDAKINVVAPKDPAFAYAAAEKGAGVSGKVDSVTITTVAATVVSVTKNKTLVLTDGAAFSGLYAYSYKVGSTNETTYYPTAKSTTYSYTAPATGTDVLTIVGSEAGISAEVKLTFGSNIPDFKIVKATGNFTFTLGADTAPVIAGGASGDEISLTKGFATVGDLGTGVILNAVYENAENAVKIASQITVVKGETEAANVVYATISGTVTQTAPETTLPAEGTNNALIVGEKAKLIIAEKKTVKVSAATINGNLDLYGNLVGATALTFAPAEGKAVKIGPYAYTNFVPADEYAGTIQNTDGVGLNKTINGYTSIENDDAIVTADRLLIDTNGTLSIDGNLGLNGHKIIVKGKLIVTGSVFSIATIGDHVTVDNNVIIVESTGVVEIKDEFAINTYIGIVLDTDAGVDLIVRGVDGLVYSAAEYKDATVPAICGDLVPVSTNYRYEDVVPTVMIVDDETLIPLPLNISKGVTLDLVDNEIVAGGLAAITLEGALIGEEAALTLTSLSSITINGIVDGVTIQAYEGVVSEDADDEPDTYFEFAAGSANVGTTDAPAYKKTFVSGLTISVVPFVVDKTLTEQRIYIDGELGVGTSDITGAAPVDVPVVGISGDDAVTIYIEEDDKLAIPAASKLEVDITQDTTFVVEGMIESAVKLENRYIGGSYIIETTGTAASTTYFYEPLIEALKSIELAKDKTVEASVEKIDFDIDILDKQTLNLKKDDTTISSKATVTIESGAFQTGESFNKILGAFVHVNGGTIVVPADDAYACLLEKADRVIYCGAQVAIDLSEPGDVITIGEGEIDGNMNVPDDRTVIITEKLIVGGNLEVEDGAKVILNGGIIEFDDGKDAAATTHNMKIDGELDGDGGDITKVGTDKIAVTVNGTMSVPNADTIDRFDSYNGASYETTAGIILTTIDQAITGAVEAAFDYQVKIHGNVAYTDDLSVEKVTIVFNDAKATLTAGAINLDDATIDVTNGTFTGTVTANVLLLGSATVEFTAVKGDLKITEDNGMTLSDGLTAGIVSLESGVTIFGDLTMGDALLMVGEHATAHVHGETKITNGVFTIVGTVAADNGGRLVLEGGINMVSATGTLVAQSTATAGNIDITTLTVYGTLKNDGGNIEVKANGGLIIGAEPTSLGAANGTVTGNIVAGENIILIFAGAEFADLKIGGATPRSTVFMINGVEYMYMVASGAYPIAEVLKVPDYDLPGYDNPGKLKETTGWDGLSNSAVIGNPAIVTATLEKSTAEVTVSPIKGMSIVIDGVTYKNTTVADLKVGTHTLSFTLDPGYKIKDGSSVTMTFNGVKVTNAIIITPEMIDQDPILAASGEIVIDQEIPEQEKQDDTVIIILLAILVVMVVILAIVTILRMMRS